MVKRKLPPELESWLLLHYPDKTNKELAEELSEMISRDNQTQLERLNILLEEDFSEGTRRVIQKKIEAIQNFKGVSISSIKRYARDLHCQKKTKKHMYSCAKEKARSTNIKRWLKKAEKVEHIAEWLRTFEVRNVRCCIVEDEGKLRSIRSAINKFNRCEGYSQGVFLSSEYISEARLLRVFASSYSRMTYGTE